MDPDEATKAVYTRIHQADPDHASKIMGYILLQDQCEKEMLRLALGPETMMNNVISVAKNQLGISSNALSASSCATSPPSAVSPGSVAISRPNPVEIAVPSSRMGGTGFGLSSPSSPSMWAVSGSKKSNHPLSYAAVVNGSNGMGNGSFSNSPISSPRLPFGSINGESEFNLKDNGVPLTVHPKSFAFGNESVDLGVNGERGSPHFHRRSCSDVVCFDGDDSGFGFGFGFKPCMYFQRGFCMNGSGCKFVHGGENNGENGFGEHDNVVSPCKFESSEQGHGGDVNLMRSRVAAQQQRFAASQLMNGVNFPYNKLNFLNTEAQRSTAAALIIGDEFHKLNRCRIGRNEFTGGGGGDVSPGSRQIYLTFPADSTFREEDVSNYFRIYGPVQDVRIPYQQKRMFGFVTFVYPETVKLILAKGNPHFVCDSRVLVKPYKEKGKLPDKKLLQYQFDRNELVSGIDHGEPFDIPLGPRMMYSSTQELLWRRKLEQQAGLQYALELQSRRLMNLKLMDLKSHYQPLHNIPFGSPIHSPHLNVIHPSNGFVQDPLQEDVGSSTASTPDGQLPEEMNAAASASAAAALDGTAKETNSINDECDLPESFEHILPDNLFSSPTKSGSENRSIFSLSPCDINVGNASNDSLMAAASTLSKAPLKSCYFEMPRFTPGQGAIGM
ncbi:Zinc finger CCCH domain-containing protein [Drosera capensis]